MRSLCGFTMRLAAIIPVSLLISMVPAGAAATFNVTTKSVSNGVDGVAYTAQLASANGTGKVTWTLASGSLLVKGLSLSSAGKITGTPTASTNGAGSFKVTAKDSAVPAHTVTATVSYIINPENGAFRITTTKFPVGTVGFAYTSSIKSSGGTGKVTYKLINSTKLPAGLILSATGAITGKPTAASAGKNFWVQATDSAAPTAKTVKAYLGILVLPALKITSNLPPGSAGTPYGGTISVSGGAATYTWTVNGKVVPANGAQAALGDNLNIFVCDNGNLCIGGSPTSAATLSIKVSVKDTAGAVGGPATYSIKISAPQQGYQVNGQINLTNCGGTVPAITVKISTNPVQATTTVNNGQFSFQNVPNGTYTVTPSISGVSSIFYPATQSVTVNGSVVSSVNFQTSLGYTVSGTVNYAGAKTGRIYLALTGNNCGGTQSGTSIAAKGAFTIRGVQPGTYTLQGWMDNLGSGAQNASNPAGSKANLIISTAGLSSISLTLTDPSATTLTTTQDIQGVSPVDKGAIAFFNANTDNNGVELATSYNVEWSTSKTFASVAGSKSFPAIGPNGTNIWIIGGLTNGAVLYFRAQGVAGGSMSPWSSSFGPVTIGAPTGGNTVSGTVSFSGTATGPLYTGFYDQNSGGVYVTVVEQPVSPQAYTVQVPTGTDYYHFAIIDQNKNGVVDPGDDQNTNGSGNNSSVSINGPVSSLDLTLPGGNSAVALQTAHYKQVNQNGTYQGYDLNFSVNGEIKQPASVTLVSGPNVLVPVDIGECTNCGGGNGFSFYTGTGTATPKVGNTYGLQVTYTDGSVETLNAQVAAVLSAFATGLAPTGAGGSTTPTFTWTDPANASSYSYDFNLWDSNGNQIWVIPGHNASSNGFTSAITSITWGTDPTGSDNPPSVGTLTSGETYNWQIQVQDENGNSTQLQVSFTPN